MIFILTMGFLVFPQSPTRAAAAVWKDKPYPYKIVSQDIVETLHDFAYNCGLHVSIDPSISGAVSGDVDQSSAVAFLNSITKARDLDWYSDASVLYISPTSAEQTTVVALNRVSFKEVKDSLAQSEFFDARYHLSKQTGADAAIVSGPPSFVTVIKQAIESIVNGRNAKDDDGSNVVVLRGNQSTKLNFPDP